MRVRLVAVTVGIARTWGRRIMNLLHLGRAHAAKPEYSGRPEADEITIADVHDIRPPDPLGIEPVIEPQNESDAEPHATPATTGTPSGLRRLLGSLHIRRIPKPVRYALYITPLIVALAYSAQLFWPRSVSFAYAQEACLSSPTLLPGIARVEKGAQFTADLKPTFTVAGKVLYSHTTCITAEAAPQPGNIDAIRVQPVGLAPIAKKIQVVPEPAPQVQYDAPLDKPIPSRGTIQLRISKPDKLFEYRFSANGHETPCTKTGQNLSCDTTPLGLAQTTAYEFSVQRYFGQELADSAAALTMRLTTVEPVSITDSSIKPSQTVYDKPTQLVLTLNKPAKSKSISLSQKTGDTNKPVAATTTHADNTVVITWQEPLARNASFELRVADLAADDGGLLGEPYVLGFATSAGPKVTDRNFGSSKQSASPRLTLTFDSTLAPKQDVTPFIKLTSGSGEAIAATVTKSGRTVTVQPRSALPRCYDFVVRVQDGVENEYGVSGGSAAEFRSRTLCQSVSSIGTSAQGRDLTSYTFGSGGTAILFVGATHGNEKSSAYILQNLVDYLEDNPGVIPADHTITIVPKINPDGFAANTRVNANGVDLNRNFPANNWKSTVKMPDQSVLPTGGGITALSEPESKALANYVKSRAFRMVISYHAKGNVVVPNDSGDSVAVARTYADQSPARFLANSQSGDFFDYDTTGAFEDWAHDVLGRPVIVVELGNYGTYEFSSHRTAILNLLRL